MPLLDGVADTLHDVLEDRFGPSVTVEEVKAPTGLKALLEGPQASIGGGGLLGLLAGGGRVQVDVNHNLPDMNQYLQEQAVSARYSTFY